MTTSLALTGARLITLDPDLQEGDTIVIEGDRIAAVGRADALGEQLSQVDEVLDLPGCAVLPGFIDAHAHVIWTGLTHFSTDLSGARTIGQALDALRAAVARTEPGRWLVAHGLAAGLLEGGERRLPHRAELDTLAADRPIFIAERTGHACALNTAGLERLQIAPEVPGQERDGRGAPLGVLRAEANAQASDRIDEALAADVGYPQVVAAACRQAVQAGVTTLHALDGTRARDDPGVLALLEHGERGTPRVVVYYQTRHVEAAVRLGLPRIGGCGACWVDGAFTPHTARLLEPYHDQPDSLGSLYFSDQELLGFFRDAHRAGLQICVHCVGDGAVEQALGAFQQVLQESPRADHRHRIEHAELISADQLDRARRLGLALCIQPAFNHFWRHDEFYARVLGPARAERIDPVRSLLQAELLVGAGSDSTVTPLDPMLGVHSAVNHSNPGERVDVQAAIRLFTLSAAALAFEEASKGSLSPGKLADVVVLGADPLAVDPEALKDVPVRMTVVGGSVEYDAG